MGFGPTTRQIHFFPICLLPFLGRSDRHDSRLTSIISACRLQLQMITSRNVFMQDNVTLFPQHDTESRGSAFISIVHYNEETWVRVDIRAYFCNIFYLMATRRENISQIKDSYRCMCHPAGQLLPPCAKHELALTRQQSAVFIWKTQHILSLEGRFQKGTHQNAESFPDFLLW